MGLSDVTATSSASIEISSSANELVMLAERAKDEGHEGERAGRERVATTGWLKAGERVMRTALQVGALLAAMGVAGIALGHASSLAIAAGVASC